MNKLVAISLAVVAIIVLCLVVVFLTKGSDSEADIPSCMKEDDVVTCHQLNDNPYRFYGTSTPYNEVLRNISDSDFHFPGCTPKMFYLMVRHGSRYPNREDIQKIQFNLTNLQDRIIENFNDGSGNMCELDIEKLKSWNMTMVPDDAKRLSKNGQLETIALAERYKRRFPTILERDFSPYDFVFEYTSRERTLSSAMAFAEGLFGVNNSIHFSGQTNDEVLRSQIDCSKLQKNCNDSEDHLVEWKKFKDGPVMEGLIKRVSKKIGFDVSRDDVEVMYRACYLEYSMLEDDVWCAVFSKANLKILEFLGDIHDYYAYGNGNALNYKQACPQIDYIVRLLKTTSKDQREEAVLQFSHSSSMKKIFPGLGLFLDARPLTASNLCAQEQRQWKSSLITPFNNNLAIVLFQCDKQKIVAFNNEKPVTLRGCKSELCPLEDFFAAYENIPDDCNADFMCCS